MDDEDDIRAVRREGARWEVHLHRFERRVGKTMYRLVEAKEDTIEVSRESKAGTAGDVDVEASRVGRPIKGTAPQNAA